MRERGRDGPPSVREGGRKGGEAGGGRSFGLAESASADSQKPSDVARRREGGEEAARRRLCKSRPPARRPCSRSPALPPWPSPRLAVCALCRRFAKRSPPPLNALCLKMGQRTKPICATYHRTNMTFIPLNYAVISSDTCNTSFSKVSI